MDRLFPYVASLLSERGLFYVVVVDDNDPRVCSLTYLRAQRFYRAMLCIRGTSHGPVSVSVCLCPSVTSRCSAKTAKRRITKQQHTIPQGL